MAKKEFPEIKEKNEGKFTKWVEKNMSGMDTCKAASKVIKSRTKKYSPAVVKMANYANNFGCKTKREDGTSVPLKGKQKNLPDALKSKILASDGASMKDPDVKAAKKEIRKGGNVSGGSNVIEELGHKHGYQSDKVKELDNSRLVVRKRRQGNRSLSKFNKIEVSKFGKEHAATPKKYGGGTKKEGNKIARQLNKENKQSSKDKIRSSRLNAKANRIKARI